MDCAQKEQGVRGRNVDQEPTVEKMVKTALPLQLPLFFANIFQIVEFGPQAFRNQNSQLLKKRNCLGRVCQRKLLNVP
jgi:hypothetical protein